MADDNRWSDRDRDWRDDRSWWEGRDDGRGGYGGDREFGRYSSDSDHERARRHGGRGAYGQGGRTYGDRTPTSYSEAPPRRTGRGYGDQSYNPAGLGGGNDPGLDNQARYGDYDRDRHDDQRRYSAYGYGADEYGYGGGTYADTNRSRGRDWRSGGEERSWTERAGDRISAFFGDDDAEARVRQRELARGEHRGRGPKGYRRSDERIRDDVNDRLTDDAWLDASNIDVSVSESEVTLTGTVRSRDDKRRAENLAESISGVGHVQNNLRVNASGDESLTSAISSIPPG
ncbi:BON domain-containing protein [Caulobacter sp. NIBR2454]|uniref:BON domain-containing protein n=1 Tax=Caulobacter sp. NIBR2454 TaxID=3015996 RepID=UPI0022B754E2|nr:BON domain-containing protein [Caulobacter sp. NIBR2454]